MPQPIPSQSWPHCRTLSLRRAATPAATPAATKRLVNRLPRKVLNQSEMVGDIQTLFKHQIVMGMYIVNQTTHQHPLH
jgi:hypothetical protein